MRSAAAYISGGCAFAFTLLVKLFLFVSLASLVPLITFLSYVEIEVFIIIFFTNFK